MGALPGAVFCVSLADFDSVDVSLVLYRMVCFFLLRGIMVKGYFVGFSINVSLQSSECMSQAVQYGGLGSRGLGTSLQLEKIII